MDSCLVFSSKGHWASLEFITTIAFEFVSGISSGHFPRTSTGKASYEDLCSRPYFFFFLDRTLGLQFKLIFAQLLEHSRGVARIVPWGTWPKYRFHNFCKCNLGQYSLPRGCVIPGGSEYFPKIPKRVCAAQQGRDFGTLSFTATLGLSCCVSPG